MYNVARVYELLGELSKATSYYERYRAMLPVSETEERERVASILMRLQGARSHVVPEPVGPPDRFRCAILRSKRNARTSPHAASPMEPSGSQRVLVRRV